MTKKQEDKKTKAQIEREKLQELTKDYKVNINIIENNKEFILFELTGNFCPKAYQRPRKGLYSVFDPIANYKNVLKKLFNDEIKLKIPEAPFEGYCEINTEYYTKLAKGANRREQLLAYKKIYRPLNRDVDNLDKTLFDCLNKFIFKDDGEIIKSISEKFYGSSDHFKATVKINKQLPITTGRLTKEEIEEWNNITEF